MPSQSTADEDRAGAAPEHVPVLGGARRVAFGGGAEGAGRVAQRGEPQRAQPRALPDLDPPHVHGRERNGDAPLVLRTR